MILRIDSWEKILWPILYDLGAFLVATQLRQLKKCIDYEPKSADNPNVLANFCKLLSLTYYSWGTSINNLQYFQK